MNYSLDSLRLKSPPAIDPLILNAIVTSNLLCFSEIVGLFGIVGNVVNIINFKKQGYKDGANVTFTALSISDLGFLVTTQIFIHVVNPWTNEADFIMVKNDMLLLVVYLTEYFVRVSGLITSFASFERCLCVVLPIKVKRFVNSKISTIVNTGIAVFLLGYLIMPYSFVYIDGKYMPDLNKTILHVYTKESKTSYFKAYYIFAGLFLPYTTIIMLTVFTTILVIQLKNRSLWRYQACKADENKASFKIPYKERKAISILTILSAIYIVGVIPHSALNMAVGMVVEMKINGSLVDVTSVCYSITTMFETVICSVPVIFYYRRSTKYREALFTMFPFLKKNVELKNHKLVSKRITGTCNI